MNGTNGTSTSAHGPKKWRSFERFEETPLYIAVLTYLGYAILIVVGHLRDLLRKWQIERLPIASEPVKPVSINIFYVLLTLRIKVHNSSFFCYELLCKTF